MSKSLYIYMCFSPKPKVSIIVELSAERSEVVYYDCKCTLYYFFTKYYIYYFILFFFISLYLSVKTEIKK